MRSVVKAFRATAAEFAAWRAAAEEQGLTYNAWARRAQNEQAALERALAKQEEVQDEG